MNTTDVPMVLSGALCFIVFSVSFLAGDIAGWIMERKWKRQWEAVAARMGFDFCGQRNRWPSLSNFLLPKLLMPDKESPFCYGESLKTFMGKVREFDVTISDFTAWNLYSCSSPVFRAPVVVFQKEGALIPGTMVAVKAQSMLINGFVLNALLREYRFPHDKDFSSEFVFFGEICTTPWTFTSDLRDLFVAFHRDIDCIFMGDDGVVLICNDSEPERFPDLVEFGVTVMSNLLEDAREE
jgi:hypothetical protein